MLIELQDIHKYYGSSKANNGISLVIQSGTIHGILGENGAGKSTLMRIMAGYLQKTRGSVLINGFPVNVRSPEHAMKLGIGMLYQDPLDFPSLSVLDNFMIGQLSGAILKKDDFRKRLLELTLRFDFRLNPDSLLKTITVGERQQLEMLRLLSLGIEVLILDEPTTGISTLLKDTLFSALRALAEDGKSIILVSHKLEDVEALCGKVTVLRQGKVSGEMTRPFNSEKLLGMIFGTMPSHPVSLRNEPGPPLIELKAVSATGGRAGLKDCSTVIRKGEIVGIAGLEGSGQEVFLRVASGIKKPASGTILLAGRDMRGKHYHSFMKRRVAFMPTSRLEEGLVPGLSIAEHFALRYSAGRFFLRKPEWILKAEAYIAKFNIRGNPDTSVENLSGGNQQRLLLSLLSEDTELLLLENPTRGLDVESTNWIWSQLQEQYSRKRAAIVFSSTELDEIFMIAERILVFFDGRLIKDVKKDNTSIHELGMAIAGKIDA